MDRRTFLGAAGAFASVGIDPSTVAGERPEAADRTAGSGSGTSDVDLAAVVRSLPAANGPVHEPGYAVSATRLDGASVTTTEAVIADATACGTVFAGRVAVDVAFGLPDRDAFVDRLVDGGHESRGARGDWTLLGRRGRSRHRVAAVRDSTAVVGAGPVRDVVAERVGETVSALDREAGDREADDREAGDRDADDRDAGDRDRPIRASVLDHLGSGTHLSVDAAPDPRRAGESAVATGERYDVRGETTAVRTVTLFESIPAARAADADGDDTARAIAGLAGTDVSVRRRGRAVLRDATVPTDRLSRP